MTKLIGFVLAGVGVFGASEMRAASVISSDHKPAPTANRSNVPVLVELFTSEGCSSCPPADELLQRLQRDQPIDRAVIIPLSEHVDYWDNASWRDPFSSASFSARQGAYVRAMRLQSSYTPQMVVDGRAEFVGSDEGAARSAISSAALVQKAKVEVAASFTESSRITVNVSVADSSVVQRPHPGDVYLAITENNLASRVRGGENEGRHLAHTAVVRILKRIGTVGGGAPFRGEVTLGIEPGWKKRDLSVVAFVQSRESGRILGVGMAESGFASSRAR